MPGKESYQRMHCCEYKALFCPKLVKTSHFPALKGLKNVEFSKGQRENGSFQRRAFIVGRKLYCIYPHLTLSLSCIPIMFRQF